MLDRIIVYIVVDKMDFLPMSECKASFALELLLSTNYYGQLPCKYKLLNTQTHF